MLLAYVHDDRVVGYLLGADLRVSSSRNHFGCFAVVDFDRVVALVG